MRSTLFILVALVASAVDAADVLSPDVDYQASRSDAVTYDVDFSVVVTPPYKTRVLKVWLPIPPTDFGQELLQSDVTSFPMRVRPQISSEPEYGNRFAYFEFHDPAGAQVVRHRYRIKVWELRWELDAALVTAPATWPTAFDRFRGSDAESVVVDDRFAAIARQIVPQPRNPLHDLQAVMKWVDDHFAYDHAEASLRASSVHGLEKRRGHCSDYHGFCASVGRALGYPTRITYGIHAFAKNSPSHCKLEAFVPPYGWVSFDVSETQKLIRAIEADRSLEPARKRRLKEAAEERLAGGFRDNTWYCQTRGTNYQLAPPARARVPVVRTAYVEADGCPLPDPDPANKQQRAFSWMTVHEYRADRAVTYPFEDLTSLEVDDR